MPEVQMQLEPNPGLIAQVSLSLHPNLNQWTVSYAVWDAVASTYVSNVVHCSVTHTELPGFMEFVLKELQLLLEEIVPPFP